MKATLVSVTTTAWAVEPRVGEVGRVLLLLFRSTIVDPPRPSHILTCIPEGYTATCVRMCLWGMMQWQVGWG